MAEVARILHEVGFTLVATKGTAARPSPRRCRLKHQKVQEGRPNIVDTIKDGQIALVINTVEEKRGAVADSSYIRRAALQARLPIYHDCWRQSCGLGHSGWPELTPIRCKHF